MLKLRELDSTETLLSNPAFSKKTLYILCEHFIQVQKIFFFM